MNRYDVAYVRFDVPKNDIRAPEITERPPRFGNIDEWMKTQKASIKEHFDKALTPMGRES